MSTILHILTHNIIPVFIIMSVGFTIEKKFDLHISSLTKINFYGVTPCFIFANLYSVEIPFSMIYVILFIFALMAASWIVALIFSRLLSLSKSDSSVIVNAVIFLNSGNMGLPIITLVFASSVFFEQAITIQISVLLIQSIGAQTLGFYIARRGNDSMHWKESLRSVFKMPAIYAGILVLIFKMIPIDLQTMFFWPSVIYIKDMMIGLALMTFGVQLAKTEWKIDGIKVFVPVFLRLVIGPLIAFLLIKLFNFSNATAQVLLISATMPTAVNTALVAVESNNSPKLASQVVMLSTIMSLFALTIVIGLSTYLFPVSL